MFSWASGTIEKLSANAAGQLERLSQTVAPAPTDPPSRFVFCCQKGDEQGAIAAVSELADIGVMVSPAKGQTALHVACLQALPLTVRHILMQPGAAVQLVDAAGNTPLHCAAMSSHPTQTLQVVKSLITEFQASVTAKNAVGETPYDVAPLNVVRQYLLPLQLQEETRIALDNGGAGLPPGIDLGGLKISNSHLSPPPTAIGAPGPPPQPASSMGAGPPPQQQAGRMGATGPPQAGGVGALSQPPQQQPTIATTTTMASPPAALGMPAPPAMSSISSERRSSSQPVTPTDSSSIGGNNNAVPPAPTSTGSDYARRGYSSAAIGIRNSQGRRVLKPDGFHSSSSDKNLQAKYGHQPAVYGSGRAVPPPPSSGNSSSHAPQSAPPSMGGGGPNPFALSGGGGGSAGPATARLPRYVAVDPVTGQQSRYGAQPPPPMSAPQQQYQVPSFTTFSPGTTPQQQSQYQQQQPQSLYQQPHQQQSQQVYQQPAAPQHYASPSTTTSCPAPYAPPQASSYPLPAAAASPPAVATTKASAMFQTPSPTQPFPKPPQSGGSASAAELFSSSAAAPAATIPTAESASGLSTLPQQQQQQQAQTQPAATTFSSPPPTVTTSLAPPPGSGNSPFGQGGANAKDLFSRPSTAVETFANKDETATTNEAAAAPATETSTETGTTTEALSTPAPTAEPSSEQVPPTSAVDAAPVDAPVAVITSGDTEEDDMQEVSLSPSPQEYKVQLLQQPAGAAAAAAPADAPSLYAAIGMPPPPMSKQ